MDENTQRCSITVTLRIRLEPEDDITAGEIAAAIARWESVIEREWSNQFMLVTRDTVRCTAFVGFETTSVGNL